MQKIIYSLVFFLLATAAHAQRNVILIIADDLGTDYCGFYETHLDTVAMPNVRRLLGRGVRFRNAWSNPPCSPTRSGMLTGRYSFRTGVGNAVGGAASAVLDTAEITIPRLLHRHNTNIAKANIGKWHLQLPMPTTNYVFPNVMGYDRFEGNFTGVLADYYNWAKVTNGVASTCTTYATTETTNNAIAWIKTQPNKPFFLWLAYNAPHVPYHLPPANLHSDQTLTGAAADITANPKAYFKASVEALDTEMGRLFDSLQVLNRFDSTDIIFMGDNGDDATVSQGSGGAKGSVYQDGVCVPFIISGPSIVNPNRASDALVNTADMFATVLELFGDANWRAQIPANKPVDSKSMLPILKNQATDIRDWTFTEVFKIPTVPNDGKAMRNQDFKLIHFDNGTEKFFNLTTDPNENTNLLLGTLNSTQSNNYTYLCNEMSNLVGTTAFCNPAFVGTENAVQVLENQVYPNPFTARIYVKTAAAAQYFELKNSLGQTVFKGQNIYTQDFSYLPQGVYFLTTNAQTFKLIKA
jgi:arylsulfatase B